MQKEARIERFLRREGGSATAADIIKGVEWVSTISKSVKRMYNFINSRTSLARKVPHRQYPLTKKKRAERRKYAKEHKNQDPRHIHWQDETVFTLYGNKKNQIVYLRSRGTPTIQKDTYTSMKVTIWGCMGANGACSMHRIEGSLTGVKHLELLTAHFTAGGGVLVQDNAKPHISNMVKQGVLDLGVTLQKLPVRSPELNPIERVWAYIKQFVYSNYQTYTSFENLMAAVESA